MTRWAMSFGLWMVGLMAAGTVFADDDVCEVAGLARSADQELAPVQLEIYPNEALGDFNDPAVSLGSDGCRESAGWAFSAGWLFLKPTLDNTYFALNSGSSTTFPNGTRINNELDYQSAFRVGAAYEFCDSKRVLQVNYTSLDASQSETVAGDFLWATLGRADFASAFENYAGTASSSLDLSYQRIDASFSQPWPVYKDNVYFRYGVEYANLDLREDYTYVSAGTTGTIAQESNTVGVGPEFGVGIDHALVPSNSWMPGALSMNMVTTASLLVGQSNGHVNNFLGVTPLLDVVDDNASRLIPALHARIDLNYDVCIGNCQTTLTIGYEFHSYIRALTRVAFPDDVADGLSTNHYDNFDLHGLFASATVGF